MYKNHKIAIVIPVYKTKTQILHVIKSIPNFVDFIIAVDDCCPDKTGKFLSDNYKLRKLKVLFHSKNLGVGAATLTGYSEALKLRSDIVIKIDSDGQMDNSKIIDLITPIIENRADYTKGNRFYNLESLKSMPLLRIIGNAILSFLNKISTGYWNIFDPTNGFTAIKTEYMSKLPFDKISKRYFFESDMLFRLGTLKAVVLDVDIPAKYESEISNLKINRVIPEFLIKHLKNLLKRYFYDYVIREMSVASFELPIGLIALLFGIYEGLKLWYQSKFYMITAPIGSLFLTSLLLIVGTQLILSFLSYDISKVPRK